MNEEQLGPLAGVRVLDLSSVVSGPMAAVVLADQGADVIKIEPPGWGDGIRGLGATRNGLAAIFAMINRNKRSVAINLKHPSGQDLIRQLVQGADVVLQNYRPGKMDKLGLGYEALKSENPNLIYASISGMGEIGPYAEQRVYDYVIQGLSGAVDAQTNGDEAVMFRSIIYDKVTALMAAQGITAALFARANGAGGQQVKLTMLDAGVYFNWPDLMWNHSFVGDGVQQSADLADMYEVNATSDGAVVTHRLGGDVSGYSTDELMDLLVQNEIPAARANRRDQIVDDAQVKALGIVEESVHPRGGQMRLPRPPIQYGQTPANRRVPSPELGQHTVEVLEELGLNIDQMRDMAREGIIG